MAGAVSIASPPPVRTPEGGATDWPFQPLADCGNGNPAFYHQYFDEFDQAISFNGTGGIGTYTISGTSATWASQAGIGGQGKLSTEAVIDQIAQIQLPSPSFTQNIAPKKLLAEARVVATTNTANENFVFGLCNTGAAITAATGVVAVTDGVYFYYVGATNVLIISQAVGSVITSATIPTAAYTIAGGVGFDLAFYQTRTGDILAFIDTQLVGYIQQSQINTVNNPKNAGAVARILGTAYTATAVNLTPTVCIWTGSAAAATMTLDFITFEQER